MGLTYESKMRFKADPTDKRHGTVTGYRYGCTCEPCKQAGRRHAAEQREKQFQRKLAKLREAREAEKAKRPKPPRRRYVVDVCTVPAYLRPLMGKPDVDNDLHLCAVCGAPATNLHHIVRRGAGKWVRDGEEVRKPLVRLCGAGNASGCHGLAHSHRLHFRWNEERGRMEFRIFPEPIDALSALQAEGWWAPFECW